MWREKLRYYIEKSGWSQRELAKKVGVAPQTISRILTGAQNPSFELVLKICDTIKITPEMLLEEKAPSLDLQKAQEYRQIEEYAPEFIPLIKNYIKYKTGVVANLEELLKLMRQTIDVMLKMLQQQGG